MDLLEAINNKNSELAIEIINKNPEKVNEIINDTTPLILACKNKLAGVAMHILKLSGHGNPTYVTSNKDTALLWATYNEMKDVSLAILNTPKNGKPDAVDGNGYTALIYACLYNMREVALKIIETNQSNPTQINKGGYTALIYACMNKMTYIAMSILYTPENGNLLYVDPKGNTALIYACATELTDIALAILNIVGKNNYAYINHASNVGNTARMFALKNRMTYVLEKIDELNSKAKTQLQTPSSPKTNKKTQKNNKYPYSYFFKTHSKLQFPDKTLLDAIINESKHAYNTTMTDMKTKQKYTNNLTFNYNPQHIWESQIGVDILKLKCGSLRTQYLLNSFTNYPALYVTSKAEKKIVAIITFQYRNNTIDIHGLCSETKGLGTVLFNYLMNIVKRAIKKLKAENKKDFQGKKYSQKITLDSINVKNTVDFYKKLGFQSKSVTPDGYFFMEHENLSKSASPSTPQTSSKTRNSKSPSTSAKTQKSAISASNISIGV